MLGQQSLLVAVVAAFGFAFSESGLGLGMFVPGESAVLAIGAAVDGPVATLAVFAAVLFGACAGDHLGYWIGRTQGERVRASRAVDRIGGRHWDRAMAMMQRRGASAVFVTRLVPVVRTLTPAAAGSSGLAYGRFLLASVAGSALWSATYVGGGAVAMTASAAAYERFGSLMWWLLVLVGGGVIVVGGRRRVPRRVPVTMRAGVPPPHHSDLAAAPDLSLTGHLQP
ncbi:MAG TPA: DedA family protein [Nocardioidaceae bacterium]|nr:DedA family protein [Nocardioidaceae bacterium]